MCINDKTINILSYRVGQPLYNFSLARMSTLSHRQKRFLWNKTLKINHHWEIGIESFPKVKKMYGILKARLQDFATQPKIFTIAKTCSVLHRPQVILIFPLESRRVTKRIAITGVQKLLREKKVKRKTREEGERKIFQFPPLLPFLRPSLHARDFAIRFRGLTNS